MAHLTFQAGIHAHYYKDNGDDTTILLWLNDFMLSNTNNEIGFSHNELLKAIPDDLSEHEEDTLLDWFAANYGTPYEEWYSGDADIIRQCTGLKDKNGKLIYENDVVRFDTGADFDILTVKWDEETAMFALITNYEIYDFTDYSYDELEVIGNIHENKELLDE